MILGLGTDLADGRRIADTLERHGARFTQRVFTAAEQDRCDARADRAAAYTRVFAAKEACAKALGTGVGQYGVRWRDMAVTREPAGRPTMHLDGAAARCLDGLVPPEHASAIHLSISDEPPLAQAVVILEAVPVTA